MVQGCLSRIWIGFSRFATATLIWPRPLRSPSILSGFSGSLPILGLAAERGLALTEADVFAAQQREHHARTAAELQQDQAAESRRLHNFIHG